MKSESENGVYLSVMFSLLFSDHCVLGPSTFFNSSLTTFLLHPSTLSRPHILTPNSIWSSIGFSSFKILLHLVKSSKSSIFLPSFCHIFFRSLMSSFNIIFPVWLLFLTDQPFFMLLVSILLNILPSILLFLPFFFSIQCLRQIFLQP